MIEIDQARRRRYLNTCRLLAAVSFVAALGYLRWLLFDTRPDDFALQERVRALALALALAAR
jgi:hypothetical protein